jgi:hypothetical protein
MLGDIRRNVNTFFVGRKPSFAVSRGGRTRMKGGSHPGTPPAHLQLCHEEARIG